MNVRYRVTLTPDERPGRAAGVVLSTIASRVVLDNRSTRGVRVAARFPFP
jgi:hypothetical protein